MSLVASPGFDEHEFEWIPGVDDGQEPERCCSQGVHRYSDKD